MQMPSAGVIYRCHPLNRPEVGELRKFLIRRAMIVFIVLVAYVAVTKVDGQDARHSEHPHLHLGPHPELVPGAD